MVNGVIRTVYGTHFCIYRVHKISKLLLIFCQFHPIHASVLLRHHHRHISIIELGHLLTRSGLTCPEVSSKVCHDSFCQLWNSVSLPWVICYGAFYLHVASSSSCIPVIYPKLVLSLIPLQFVYFSKELKITPI